MTEHNGSGPSPRRNSRGGLLVGLLILLLVAGLAGGTTWYLKSSRHQEIAVDVNVNTVPGAPVMPDWLMSASPLIKTEYIWAATHLKELQYIPCYCGCNASGHRDNFSCYFQRDDNGKILSYDQMSFT